MRPDKIGRIRRGFRERSRARDHRILSALALAFGGATGCYSGVSGYTGVTAGGAEATDAGDGAEGGDDGWVPEVGECDPTAVGRSTLRRLNQREYRNTLRDLFDMPVLPSFALPIDPLNAKGLDNDGDALTFDLASAERYYDAAVEVSGALDVAGARPFPGCVELTASALHQCVDAELDRWLTRAFRHPATPRSLELLRELVKDAQTYEEASQIAVVFTLTSPHFLLHHKATGGDGAADPYERAGRLSYLVWSSMPDDELLAAAADGTLDRRDGLEAEVARMLAHPKAERFYADFSSVWLKLESLESKPDAEIHPELLADMRAETSALFERIGRDGESIDRLMEGGESWVSGRLAAHYGLETTLDDDEWDLLSLPAGERAGIMTHGSVLAASAGADFSDPIRRGAWIAESLGCQQPALPSFEPPELPEAEEDETIRELIERHTSDPACAPCHTIMDPYGMALENYDRMGAFRTEYDNGRSVDASGELLTGDGFDNAVELSQLMVQSGQFESCMAEYLWAYGVGRALTQDEMCFVELALEQAHQSEPEVGIEALMTTLVTSYLFASDGEGR